MTTNPEHWKILKERLVLLTTTTAPNRHHSYWTECCNESLMLIRKALIDRCLELVVVRACVRDLL